MSSENSKSPPSGGESIKNWNKMLDPAIEAVKKALGDTRFRYVQDQLDEILRENVSEYAKKFKLEFLLQSLQVGVTNSGDLPISVGPCHIAENKDVRTSVKPITFPEYMWSAKALAYMSTRTFFDQVLKMSQAVINHSSIQNPPPVTPGGRPSEAQLEQVRAITTLMNNITDDHYSLISLSFLLYAFLDALFIAYKAKKFLFLMSQIRSAVLHYNAHHPGSNPHLEQASLYELRKILGIVDNARNFVTSYEFYQLMQGGEKTMAAPSAKAKAEALASLWSAIPAEQVQIPAAVSKMEIQANSEGVPVSAVFRIKAEEVRVDISRSRPLPDVVTEIGTNIRRVIDHTLGECDEIIRVAQQANYNLATGQWGSFFALSDNERHIRELESIIFQEAGAIATDLLSPRFYFITQYTTLMIPTRLSFSKVAYTEGVKPGQTVKFRVTTGTTTKETTAQTQSIAETQTEEAQDDYEDELTTAMAESNTVSTDDQKYSDSSNSVTQNKKWDFGASLDISVGKGGVAGAMGYSVDASLAYNCSEDTDTSKESSQSLSEQVQTEREVSNDVQKKALAKHTTKKSATRQTNVTASTEVATETTKQESRDEEFTNPSNVAPMTVFFLTLVQEYVAIRAITNFSICFVNGVDYKEFPLTDFSTAITEYLEVDQPGVQVAVDMFRRFIRLAGVIQDFRGRDVVVLDETPAGNFKFKKDPYFYLVEGGLDEQDIDIAPVKDRVFGAVISVEAFKMTSPGYFTICLMGPPVVDDNAQRMFEASLQARDLENDYKNATVEAALIDTKVRARMLEFILSVREVNEVVKFQKEAMFELLKENKEMWDKRYLLDRVLKKPPENEGPRREI